MNKKLFIPAIVLGLLICVFARPVYYKLKPKPLPWTKEYIQNLHDQLYDSADKNITNQNQREQVVSCLIEKFRHSLPGGLESVSKDSVYNLTATFLKSCVVNNENIEAVVYWSDKMEQNLKEKLLKQIPNSISIDEGIKTCDCYISKLKSKYPNGIPITLTDSARNAIFSDCIDQVEKSN